MIEPTVLSERASEDVQPDPSALIESLRAFGYSLESAVADLIDNSITAGAARVDVQAHWNDGRPFVSVQDDGAGMDESALRRAMRLGSKSPRASRGAGDLGRFGLGLKTAAFSQGRMLTVASKCEGADIAARRWDLDLIERTGEWTLLTNPECAGWDPANLLARPASGTVVRVDDLDRLAGTANPGKQSEDRFLAHLPSLQEHLAMVYHRLIGPRLEVTVNGNSVQSWDPFLVSGEAQSERLADERETIDGEAIHVRSFVLPHHSRLSDNAHSKAAGPAGWNAQQGFYVYREKRLLVAGGWLDLGLRQEEHYKLARVQVDLPNSLDELWQIDVRKSSARIPPVLKPRFNVIAKAARRRASDVYRFKGKIVTRSASTGPQFAWLMKKSHERTEFLVNRAHPAVTAVMEDLSEAQQKGLADLLSVLEATLPREAIFIAAIDGDKAQSPAAEAPAALVRMARQTFESVVALGTGPRAALELVADTEPFSTYPEIIATLAEEEGIDTDGS